MPGQEVSRDWWVYSTTLASGSILVRDRNSEDRGHVPDPTAEEWRRAFHAPSENYPWPDAARVVVDAAPFPAEIRKQLKEGGRCETK